MNLEVWLMFRIRKTVLLIKHNRAICIIGVVIFLIACNSGDLLNRGGALRQHLHSFWPAMPPLPLRPTQRIHRLLTPLSYRHSDNAQHCVFLTRSDDFSRCCCLERLKSLLPVPAFWVPVPAWVQTQNLFLGNYSITQKSQDQ